MGPNSPERLFSPFSESEMDRENRLKREWGKSALEEVLGELEKCMLRVKSFVHDPCVILRIPEGYYEFIIVSKCFTLKY